MATEQRTSGLTWRDLYEFPDDGLRRELIGGELIVTPRPTIRHQQVMFRVTRAFVDYADQHGGAAVPDANALLDEGNFVEPDVFYVAPENLGKLEELFVRSAPDVVVEISSPSTRERDVTSKKDLYERFGVREYWFVDLDAERVEVYLLEGDRFGKQSLHARGESVESSVASGLTVDVDAILGSTDRT